MTEEFDNKIKEAQCRGWKNVTRKSRKLICKSIKEGDVATAEAWKRAERLSLERIEKVCTEPVECDEEPPTEPPIMV